MEAARLTSPFAASHHAPSRYVGGRVCLKCVFCFCGCTGAWKLICDQVPAHIYGFEEPPCLLLLYPPLSACLQSGCAPLLPSFSLTHFRIHLHTYTCVLNVELLVSWCIHFESSLSAPHHITGQAACDHPGRDHRAAVWGEGGLLQVRMKEEGGRGVRRGEEDGNTLGLRAMGCQGLCVSEESFIHV